MCFAPRLHPLTRRVSPPLPVTAVTDSVLVLGQEGDRRRLTVFQVFLLIEPHAVPQVLTIYLPPVQLERGCEGERTKDTFLFSRPAAEDVQ